MAEGKQQCIDTSLIQILLSLFHNNWMGLREVLRSTTQKWPELQLNPATGSGTLGALPEFEKRSKETSSTQKGLVNIVDLLLPL